MIKYDITLTILSFYIFDNVLPRDIAKIQYNSVICLRKFWEIFKPRWRRSIFREGLVAKF